MHELFSRLTLTDVHHDVMRNIVSLTTSQNLFDDLTQNPADWALAQQVEDRAKPLPYQSATPVIDRPFEDSEWFNAIDWPFRNWQTSRYSDGSFGVWYGSRSIETTVYETAYHWYWGLLRDAGFEKEAVIGERKLYRVACNAMLLDFRPLVHAYASLIHKTDYAYPQSIGATIHQQGHPGLCTPSVRHAGGENFVVFNPAVLSNPRHYCHLTYRLDKSHIVVEKTAGKTWLEILTGR